MEIDTSNVSTLLYLLYCVMFVLEKFPKCQYAIACIYYDWQTCLHLYILKQNKKAYFKYILGNCLKFRLKNRLFKVKQFLCFCACVVLENISDA